MAAIPPLASPTVEAIYQAYENSQGHGFREHLGASIIGRECERSLFYAFRWVRRAQHAGRILRLFQTGTLEEARLIRDLRSAGVTVIDIDPDSGRQFSVRAVDGHFGGSADGICIGIKEAPVAWHILEMKTHGIKSFNALQKHGILKSKPEHWSQLQIYMHFMNVQRGFYLGVCKDTDQLYSERVYPDPELVARLLEKAERVIKAVRPPPKISDDPEYYVCKWCDYKEICHGAQQAERNCRTCLHSTPIEMGQWHCAFWGIWMTRKKQLEGCRDGHRLIPDLVAGNQVDVNAEGGVVYEMKDGGEWVDYGMS